METKGGKEVAEICARAEMMDAPLKMVARLISRVFRTIIRFSLFSERGWEAFFERAVTRSMIRFFLLNRIVGFIRPFNKEEGWTIYEGLYYIVPFDAISVINEVKRVYVKPKKGDIVLDAGAHYGFYTLLASRLVGAKGCILAFEPHLHNYRRLVANLRLNGIKNVKTFNLALGEFNDQAKLYTDGESGAYSTFFKRGARYQNVRMVRLDTIVTQMGLEKLDLIKIDIEGAELRILEGARETIQKFKPKLTIAGYHFPNEITKLEQWLRANYEFYEIKTTSNAFLYAWPSHTRARPRIKSMTKYAVEN